MRVVNRVHCNTTHRRANALVAHAARLAEILVGVVGVRHGTDGGHAFLTDHPQFARRQAYLRVRTVATDELGISPGGAGQLTALAGLQFHVVYDRPDRHARKWHRVARLHVGLGTRDDAVTNGQTLRRQDIGKLAIGILDQRDERGAVGVIFDALDHCGDVELGAFEVHNAVKTLCASALVPHRDASGVVTATRLGQAFSKGFDGTAFPQLRTVDQNQPSLARRRRLIRLECHAFCLPFWGSGVADLRIIGLRRSPGSVCQAVRTPRPFSGRMGSDFAKINGPA